VARNGGGGGGGGSGAVAVAAEGAHCKLRLRAQAGDGRPSRPASEWLRELLRGGAHAGQEAAGEGAGGATAQQRQASAALEMPGGSQATLRLAVDAAAAAESGTATGSSDASMMFLLQCEEPALLWALRSAIVARLTTPTATARAGEGSTCVTGTGTGMSGVRDVSASGGAPARAEGAAGPRAAESGHERGATRSADERSATRPKEWAALLPLLQRWQLAHAQLHEDLSRCFELRRRFDGGAASVSLRELSLEVAHQARRALEAHQAVRGQLGCVALPLVAAKDR
jgi:hypothetical protein